MQNKRSYERAPGWGTKDDWLAGREIGNVDWPVKGG